MIKYQRKSYALGWIWIQEGHKICYKIKVSIFTSETALHQKFSPWFHWIDLPGLHEARLILSCVVCTPFTEFKRESLRGDKELHSCVIKPSTFANRALVQFDFPVITTLFGFGHFIAYVTSHKTFSIFLLLLTTVTELCLILSVICHTIALQHLN